MNQLYDSTAHFNEIDCFEDVVLFEMQKLIQSNGDRRLTFSKIWQACERAAPNIKDAPMGGLRKKFARRLLAAIENLEGLNLISAHSRGSYPNRKISHVTPTTHGIEYLKFVVFTHQERMGRSA